MVNPPNIKVKRFTAYQDKTTTYKDNTTEYK